MVLKNINSLELIQFFIDNFKLDFGNNGSAANFVNDLLKHNKKLKVQRLEGSKCLNYYSI